VKRNLPKDIKKDLEVRMAIIQIEECNEMTNLRRYPQAKQRGGFKHFAEWLQFTKKKKSDGDVSRFRFCTSPFVRAEKRRLALWVTDKILFKSICQRVSSRFEKSLHNYLGKQCMYSNLPPLPLFLPSSSTCWADDGTGETKGTPS
jgi:hypothetical protein